MRPVQREYRADRPPGNLHRGNLPACLESVAWSQDVIVFDSFSTDRTEEIARAAGARFIQREFDDYASHRNAALTKVKYEHPWVLMVDADERVTEQLAREIRTTICECDDDLALCRMRRKDMFRGRWLRHSSGYPTWFGRLIRAGRVTVRRKINEEYHADGAIAHLSEHLIHYPFNKGISYWLERHNRYSSMEAGLMTGETQEPLRLGSILSHDPALRRKSLKQLCCRMPCRPLLVFCYLYLGRLGFLDGRAGLTYCMLRSFYEYMINLKVKELRGSREDGTHLSAGGLCSESNLR